MLFEHGEDRDKKFSNNMKIDAFGTGLCQVSRIFPVDLPDARLFNSYESMDVHFYWIGNRSGRNGESRVSNQTLEDLDCIINSRTFWNPALEVN